MTLPATPPPIAVACPKNSGDTDWDARDLTGHFDWDARDLLTKYPCLFSMGLIRSCDYPTRGRGGMGMRYTMCCYKTLQLAI